MLFVHHTKRTPIILAIFIALVIVGIIFFVTTLQTLQSPAHATLVGPQQTPLSQPFPVKVVLSGAKEVSGAQLSVTYDPDVIEFLFAEEGYFLSENDTVKTFSIPPEQVQGSVQNYAIVRLTQEGVSGTGELAVLHFVPIDVAETDIVLESISLSDNQGNSLAVESSSLSITITQ